jgi:predicted MFS family arabinose efflux permease
MVILNTIMRIVCDLAESTTRGRTAIAYAARMRAPLSERKLVVLIGAVQFVNTLDFIMVMPLGPDFAAALDIPTSNLGFVGGSYTAAAALAGIAGTLFLDRFDRRRALAVALAGLVVGTAAGGLATGLTGLIAARVIAGAFGGPATALALAIVGDLVAPERRGRVLGAVMGSFSVVSVLGIPAGLELARLGGWRAPFFTVAALGAVVAVAAMMMLPPQRGHLSAARRVVPIAFREVLRRRVVQLALCGTAAGVIANFALMPNLSAYFQLNRGYPRDELGLLYLAGGAISFGTMRIAGKLTDRHGAPPVTLGGATANAIVLLCGFIYVIDAIPVLVIFVGFTVSQGFRFVPMHALLSRVPGPEERARFMSAQSAVMYLAQTVGAVVGAQLLTEHSDGSLAGIEAVAWFALTMALLHAAIAHAIDRQARRDYQNRRARPIDYT